MERSIILIFATVLFLGINLNPANAAGKPAASPTPTPAPAPAPGYVNLTELLSVAGPFHTFLNYLQSTKVMDTFQNQANNTDEGITIFVPKDDAFSSQKNPSLKNLTQDQLKSLCLFHALPHYYSFSDFKNLSKMSPVTTFGGGQYALNFTDVSGTVHIGTGWTNTKISSSVISTDPVAVYEVGKVLLPVALFGTDIPPMPAPAPAPASASSSPAADAPAADAVSSKRGEGPSASSKSTSAAYRMVSNSLNNLVLAVVVGGIALFL